MLSACPFGVVLRWGCGPCGSLAVRGSVVVSRSVPLGGVVVAAALCVCVGTGGLWSGLGRCYVQVVGGRIVVWPNVR